MTIDPITGVECGGFLKWVDARKSGIITDEMKELMDEGKQPDNVHSFSEHSVTVKTKDGFILVKGLGENHARIFKEISKISNENYSNPEWFQKLKKAPIFFDDERS